MGRTHLLFDPVEFLGRLAVLVPRPRVNLILVLRRPGCCGAPMRLVQRLTARHLFLAALLADILNDSS
jgi:hypothetical protein